MEEVIWVGSKDESTRPLSGSQDSSSPALLPGFTREGLQFWRRDKAQRESSPSPQQLSLCQRTPYKASGNPRWPVTSLDNEEDILGAIQCRDKVRDASWVSACCRKAHCAAVWAGSLCSFILWVP